MVTSAQSGLGTRVHQVHDLLIGRGKAQPIPEPCPRRYGNPDPDPNRNLAKGRPATDTGSQDVHPPGKAVDGDANSHGESTNHAFPQSWTVDLGSTQAVRRLVLTLPPSTAWGARTQTITVLGSTDGSTYSTVVGSTGHRFDPATGNTAASPSRPAPACAICG